MEAQDFIICSLNNSIYGIEASVVKEIFYLPELTPVAEAPRDIVGVLNLRGEILPVMDLYIRLGQQPQDYQLTDSIVVLNSEEFQVGVIVNQVHEVRNIAANEITTNLSYRRGMLSKNGSQPGIVTSGKFINGVAQVDEDLVMLINHQTLIEYSKLINSDSDDGDGEISANSQAAAALLLERTYNGSNTRIFCPHATPEERATFRERAENLRRATENEDFAGLIPLAVIGLNGEYFGLDLDTVREFTDISKITPVPCCPPHIVGNINLRGEIVTLVDVRGVLNLPIAGTNEASKVMVVRMEDLVAGVTVDEVFDVMYLNPTEMMPVPAAVHSINDEYLRGTAPYREKMMGVLDLPKILTKGGLTVDEEV
ncbi:CheW protein [Crinalium epipsammum PCC 9333]|uniref:CheW protein n=1 Tax=Crinalium epipsammum PCC 9333 TaxID=1173022 RepID=K9VV65_9CYAN|nr:chemotaxis protein CheW [Crinalium epipsammum]AFZ11035.1 CheW protein [Crinalium epipsammum PCC 9333]